jgi:isopenicillin-N epimerase
MKNFKKEYLLDPSVTFLNHGSFGAVPRKVFSEYQRWQRELERQPVEFLGRRFIELIQTARSCLANYVNAPQNDLVFVANATVAINIVAHSLDLKPGDEVLASDHEYGAADRTWKFLASEKGFSYTNQSIGVPIHSADQIVEQLFAGVTHKTRVIFVSHYTSPTALIFPTAEICARARKKGILTVIDGAHTPGQIELDLTSIGADFYVGNLHKWLCAPKGAAFLYAQPQVQDLIKPFIVSWGWQSERPGESRFIDYLQWTGTRDISSFLTVPAAINYQAEKNWQKVRLDCHLLAMEVRDRIQAITRLDAIYPDTPDWYVQMGTAPLPDSLNIDELKNELYAQFKIEIPIMRWNNRNLIRFSLQAYNSQKDIIKLEKALRTLLH